MAKIDNINKLRTEKGVHFRDFAYETRADEGNYIVTGTPVVFDSETYLFTDSNGVACYETIDRSAFDNADISDVIFNYNHSGRVYARTRNDTLTLAVDDNGVNMTAALWKDDEGHTELYRDIERGNIDKMSFAFTISEAKWEEAKEEDKALRIITGIGRVYDVSAVDIPAYNETQISARKELQTEREQILSERREAESRAAQIEEKRAGIINTIQEITGGQDGKENQ